MRSLKGGVAAVLLAAACGDGALPQPPTDTCPLAGDAEPAVVDIDSHAELTFALLSDGTAYCWGKDNLGGCGVLSKFDYDWVPNPARVDAADCLLQVSAGSAAVSLGVTAGGDAVSWGREINFYEAGNGPGPGPGIGRGAVLAIPEPVMQVSAGRLWVSR